MRIGQFQYNSKEGWVPALPKLDDDAQLILLFGETCLIKDKTFIDKIETSFPKAIIFGGSTAGEIYNDHVYDDTVILTVVHFNTTYLQSAACKVTPGQSAFAIGQDLANQISRENLKHVLVMSTGLNINGSDLTKGLNSQFKSQISVSGGLAADQDRFTETYVIAGSQRGNDLVAILGFYGEDISVGLSSIGGWDPFGPERLITKSKENILYELDGKSALQIYKDYLGEHSKSLPGSALLFPLSLRKTNFKEGLVRTVLSIDEETQSMVFAGDVPEGTYAQLMKANFDRVIDGACDAATQSLRHLNSDPQLALLISCVGRKIILKQRVDEEIEGVRNILGQHTYMTGFYSYGEIGPHVGGNMCELHNQTMTITTLSEKTKDVA